MWQYPHRKCCAKGSGKEVEIQELVWNVETEMYDLEPLERVTRNLRKNLEPVPGKHSIDSLQKISMLGKSQVIRKVMQSET